MPNDIEIPLEEQEWISILKEARKERLDQIKRQLDEKKEEISIRKESLAKEKDRLEQEFQDEENKLKEFYNVTERYVALKGKELSSGITPKKDPELDQTKERFLAFLSQNEEFRNFHNKKFEERVEKKGIHPHELGIVTEPHVTRYITPSIAARTILYVLQKTLGFTDLKINAYRFEYKLKIKEVIEEYDSLAQLYKEHRGKLLREAAVKLTEELEGICNELDKIHYKKDPIKMAICDSLTKFEKDGKVPPDILSEYDAESINSRLENMIESGIITDLDALKISLSFTISHEKTIEPKKEQPPETVTEEKPANGEIRYSILASFIGDENSTRRIFELNPNLPKDNWQKFESYLARFKEVTRSLKDTNRYEEINPIRNPERFSSLEALVILENDLSRETSTRTRLQEINERLQELGYDPDVVHALILSFKPLTVRKFIGKNYLPPYAIKHNIKPLIPEEKMRLVDDYLSRLVNDGVVLRYSKGRGGTYSLNPHLNEVTDPVLREALALYL